MALAVGPVTACPLCDSPSAEAVRAGLVDEHLPRVLAAIVSPLVLPLALVAWIVTCSRLSPLDPRRGPDPSDEPLA